MKTRNQQNQSEIKLTRRQALKTAAVTAVTSLFLPKLAQAVSPPPASTGVAVGFFPVPGGLWGVTGSRTPGITASMPNHPTGLFPNMNCPIPIRPQGYRLAFPQHPVVNEGLTPLNGWLFGVALNGVVFDPQGPFYKGDPSGFEYDVLSKTARKFLGIDHNNAHVQPSGQYHYHGLPNGLINGIMSNAGLAGTSTMVHLGFAADGFPVFAPYAPKNAMQPDPRTFVEMRSSYRLKKGRRIGGPPGKYDGTFVQDYEYVSGSGELDECNGRFGIICHPLFQNRGPMYHYFITNEFPNISRFYRGTPHLSFQHPMPVGIEPIPPVLRKYGEDSFVSNPEAAIPPQTDTQLPLVNIIHQNYRYVFGVARTTGQVWCNSISLVDPSADWSGWTWIPGQKNYTDRAIQGSIHGNQITIWGWVPQLNANYKITGRCGQGTIVWGSFIRL